MICYGAVGLAFEINFEMICISDVVFMRAEYF